MRPRTPVLLGLLALAACGKPPPSDEKPVAAPAVSAAAPALKVTPEMPTLAAKKVRATFLIDAPLEKIKGISEEGEGNISLVPGDLGKTSGELKIKLSALRTETFGDKSQDDGQTEHARAWMEVGGDTPPGRRRAYEHATFTLRQVRVSPNDLAGMKEEPGGVRRALVNVMGDLRIHGVTVRRELVLVTTFTGPTDAPTEVTFKTETPFVISLREHDIKPRDSVGKFLNGALEKVGKKIDDKVQISLEATYAQ